MTNVYKIVPLPSSNSKLHPPPPPHTHTRVEEENYKSHTSRKRELEVDGIGRSQTLPSSPSHSSSDFEFTIALSPRKSSSNICPADELFYKGQLLPLHPFPRLSMVRTLLVTSPTSTSSSDTSRDSTASSNSSISSDLVLLAELDSARSSSVAEVEDHELKRFNSQQINKSSSNYFSFSRLSSVFRKNRDQDGAVKNTISSSAKQVVRKYLKKVKPLYERLSQKHEKKVEITKKKLMKSSSGVPCSVPNTMKSNNGGVLSNSFFGNLRYPRRRRCVSSCPSSMRSSPNRSFNVANLSALNSSTMEELQSVIQGAIAHCKNSMGGQNKSLVSMSKEI